MQLVDRCFGGRGRNIENEKERTLPDLVELPGMDALLTSSDHLLALGLGRFLATGTW